MTRIIAGSARGRRLQVPPKGTRPTSDRVREAVFSALAARVDLDGVAVLDLYAGSGALGLEALSRGAASAVLVDADHRAATVLAANVQAVAAAGRDARVRKSTVENFLAGTPQRQDLVFLDPPYDLPGATVERDLEGLTRGWLAPGAHVLVERSARTPSIAWPEGFDEDLIRDYGETRIQLALWQDGEP
ncbi:16S rRNA (guanine(966)-N(2))-methyltransferase RsmD [Tsukamurella sp. 8F]|uniref:16S rRNA (guanine(966)-N(2))-methyltransferase RsmD n=1 Tax=unclassified Tsukamurella TaxID=2633480 RepID=UPI0023B95267|nr:MULTISPECIES: 16S rRNA (guanine(966)-N(2))-methyltransferase RsmD [unclassified Tsukamurella]MDF0531203.1 16S rRNA (guanine(966)-N(2))-methyltransferase RsmD [Tsukamurella sp. 8J]MDF0588472.1 16S rRNA (guanine(966)-N(2))-methyltransferase RsmD [Tsukamurella sp. 8F]